MQVRNKHAVRETHNTQSRFINPFRDQEVDYRCTVPLKEQDRHITIFITPWGRYRYKTCPQGYAASHDRYIRQLHEIVNDFASKTKWIDDTCLREPTLTEIFFQRCHWLDICRQHGFVQNPKTFVFGSDTVEFVGFVITLTIIQPSDKHIRAIRDFPTPQHITDFRFWFGLINRVSYCDSFRNDMAPFREHLKPLSTFYWYDQLQKVFEQPKAAILDKIIDGVRKFDSKHFTCLATDWCRKGIGCWFLQKYCT